MTAKKTRRKLKKPPLRRISGKELREWRLRYGLTQQQLAELLGVGRTTITSWETEHRSIPLYLLYLLESLERDGYVEKNNDLEPST